MEDSDFEGSLQSLNLSPILFDSQYSQPQTQFSQQSQSQSQRIYSGLLSKPELQLDEFGKLDGRISQTFRDVNLSDTFQPYTTADFLAHGAKPRPARSNKTRKGPITGSRQSRTFKSRLREYRPILQAKISKLPHWADLQRFPDIISLSTMSPHSPEEEEDMSMSVPYGWDDDQGIGFRETDRPIRYIIKKAPVKPGHIFRLCSDIGVIPIPLKPQKKTGLYLEDQTAQIRLSFWSTDHLMKFHKMVSGVPVALMGVSSGGKLFVKDLTFATPATPEWPFWGRSGVEMVFVSSLRVGSSVSSPAHLDLLFDYLQGLSGSPVEQEKMMAPKTRVFFVGNLFCKRERWNADLGERLCYTHCEIADKLDILLENTSQTMEVFILPGENDPTHQNALPQPPIHRQIFPEASQRPTFQRLTNPAKVNVCLSTSSESQDDEDFMDADKDFLNIVLTSGTNVRGTMESCDIECPLEMSSKLLEWSHLHPTSVADNELAEEIFSLKEATLPHLFVVGGLSDFKVEEWNGVKIVGVPSFATTATVVVFTKDCDIVPLSFKICL